MDIIFKSINLELKDHHMELIVIGCFLLALKFAGHDPLVPLLNQFTSSLNGTFYKLSDVRKWEDFCVKALFFKLDFYTAFDCLDYFLRNGIFFEDEMDSQNTGNKFTTKNRKTSIESFRSSMSCSSQPEKAELVNFYANDLLKQFFESNICLQFNPLQIACACVCLTRENFKMKETKSKLFEEIYKIEGIYYEACAKAMKTLFDEDVSEMNNSKIKFKARTSKDIVDFSKSVDSGFKIEEKEKSKDKNNSENILIKCPKEKSSNKDISNHSTNVNTGNLNSNRKYKFNSTITNLTSSVGKF